jgi:helicase
MEEQKSTDEITIINVISRCIEMKPGMSITKKDLERDDGSETLNDFLAANHTKVVGEIPSEWDLEYDDFIRSLKLTWLLSEWMQEKSEDTLMECFNVTPGELRARIDLADWLFYSMHEISHLLNKMEVLKSVRKTRIRVKYGIKDELLPLVKLRGVGRVRARLLFAGGYRTLEKLREAPLTAVAQIVGPNIAKSLERQLSGLEKDRDSERQGTFRDFPEPEE